MLLSRVRWLLFSMGVIFILTRFGCISLTHTGFPYRDSSAGGNPTPQRHMITVINAIFLITINCFWTTYFLPAHRTLRLRRTRSTNFHGLWFLFPWSWSQCTQNDWKLGGTRNCCSSGAKWNVQSVAFLWTSLLFIQTAAHKVDFSAYPLKKCKCYFIIFIS